eukprot:Skav231824  [mRNA]  locus=scaffold136:73789:76326:- [translate_table: standard]
MLQILSIFCYDLWCFSRPKLFEADRFDTPHRVLLAVLHPPDAPDMVYMEISEVQLRYFMFKEMVPEYVIPRMLSKEPIADPRSTAAAEILALKEVEVEEGQTVAVKFKMGRSWPGGLRHGSEARLDLFAVQVVDNSTRPNNGIVTMKGKGDVQTWAAWPKSSRVGICWPMGPMGLAPVLLLQVVLVADGGQ